MLFMAIFCFFEVGVSLGFSFRYVRNLLVVELCGF
uniref:Uncharacterized protein n=1 Tax=Rhizophora mucronata TaxID=61149 RepID=A0A2P2R4E2_RHIMU